MSEKDKIITRIIELLKEISNEYFLLRIENYVKCLKDKCSK